ncbi:hypothetical protein MRY87_11620 [bacterium]|nr:hypothetical protein [bacterium]
MPTDTDPLVQAKLDRLFAQMPLEERAERYFRLWESNRILLREGLRRRFPEASREELEEHFRELLRKSWSNET